MRPVKSAAFLAACCVALATTIACDAAEPAVVRIQRDDLTLVLVFEGGSSLKVTSKGTELAPGTYFVKSLRFYKKDEKGRTWEIRATGVGSMTNVTVAPGQEKILVLGPPIGFNGTAKQGKTGNVDTITFTFRTTGTASEFYHPWAYLGGRPGPPPVMKISTEDGKLLHVARFPRGETWFRYVWEVPRGFKGRCNLEIEAAMGPFEWALNTTSCEVE